MHWGFSAFVLAFIAWPASAKAQEATRADLPPEQAITDSTYGRIDGDIGIVFGAGVTFGPRAPRASTELRLRYIETVGIFGTYEDASWLGTNSDPRRVITAGLEFRPFFLARWLTGTEYGIDRLDLAIDSFALELGVPWSQRAAGNFDRFPGLQAGLGLEIPVFARATGIWIGTHGGLRWSDDAMASANVDNALSRSTYLSLTLSWHQIAFPNAFGRRPREL